MRGLVAYVGDDSQSDSEQSGTTIQVPPNATSLSHSFDSRSDVLVETGAMTNSRGFNDGQPQHDKAASSSSRTGTKLFNGDRSAQVVIRRPPAHLRGDRPRAHLSDAIAEEKGPRSPMDQGDNGLPAGADADSGGFDFSGSIPDELSRMRALLRPPPIPGVQDWNIPPPSTNPVDPHTAEKLTKFQILKRDPTAPKHFNDSLMSNRSFRNPHLYANLVDWAGVSDEKASNFSKDVWDPYDVQEEWYADNVAEAQKLRAEKTAASQSSGERSRIDFTSSSSLTRGPSNTRSTAGRNPDRHNVYSSTAQSSKKGSRFQPYGGPAPGGMGGIDFSTSGTGDKGRTRWG